MSQVQVSEILMYIPSETEVAEITLTCSVFLRSLCRPGLEPLS